ncbi:MAG: tetratricopeptide repeat protein [Planctomycetes bacterium]|nr:tetratricopeptide repeat protein [Planctomycetota bacterium]
MNFALVATTMLIATLAAKPQDEQRRALADLQRLVNDPRTTLGDKESRILAFLERFEEAPTPDRRNLLVRLATIELALRKPREAMQHFRSAEALCRISESEDLYVHARCRLGVAQAYELLGNEAEAIRRYAAVKDRYRGLQFARDAARALERLRALRRLEIGKRVELPRDTVNLRGEPVRAASPESATLLVFVPAWTGDADEQPGLPGTLAGLDPKLPLRIVLSCPREDARRWAQSLEKTPYESKTTVLRDRVDLALGVASLPSWALVDKKGIVLELNPSHRRLKSIFDEH